MTEEERANRNPAPEIFRTLRADIDAMRQVSAFELIQFRVYVLEGERAIATFNYVGAQRSLHPKRLEPVMSAHFHGPRMDLDVMLEIREDGTMWDADGHRIVVREYTGPDA